MNSRASVRWNVRGVLAILFLAELCASFGLAADQEHWAFQPLKRPPVPSVRSSQLVVNPVDAFILARLEAKGLKLSAPASREQLIRRVTFDLVGLPPTPAEIDAFIADTSPNAYEKLLDRLLASPHYGERWGRHWLDLVRFAETDGYEHDAVRPHAWRYRDYVVRSFNADKPYDRFMREQIAGDELWPGETDALIATGFALLGPDMVDSADQVQRRINTLNDATDTVGFAFLGLTLACARCHDHKFEPFTQRDYFAMQAHFTPAAFRRELPIPAPAEREAYEVAMSEFKANPVARELAALEGPVRRKLFEAKLARLSPEAQDAHRTPTEKRNAEQSNLALETASMLEITEKELVAVFKGDERTRRKDLLDELKKLPKPPALPMAMVLGSSNGAPEKTFVLRRGEYSQPGDEVGPGFPHVVMAIHHGGTSSSIAPGASLQASGRRAALANWLASADNPLTARVMVNRIWQHHFGRGLVATPSDFGTRGQRPTHPELLDWLAGEFVARGWGIKQMHKLILMSATYQASAVASHEALAHDPENKLYSHWSRLRLEGEVIRDSLLAIGGRLNLAMNGPGVFPPIPAEMFKGAKGWTPGANADDSNRRSIYIFARRNLRFPFLEVFDAPDSNLSCPERLCSTTAPQSLTLLNAEDVLTAARALAARVEREAPTADERVALAHRLTLGRWPGKTEARLGHEFLAASPLSEFCRVMFNLNAFIYVE
ncbi:MAG: DUF1553 domain-containing protein [Verrucomicrobia bacterium]|nr:DUF1553 domain-containing protein [Verrucomicrobiota bacterium]